MKPKIFTITICRNEDVWIGQTIRAWLPFAETMFVQDTGSTDGTMGALCDIVAEGSGKVMVGQYAMDVGAAMVERQRLIERIPKDHDYWIVVLDADELWDEENIRALIKIMGDPEVDAIGVRPVPIGWDGESVFYTSPLEPFDPEDAKRFTTPFWCPKVTTRAYRSTRLDLMAQPEWGKESYIVKLDPARHRLTPDYKHEGEPDGYVCCMYTGRTKWTDLWYSHMSYVTRSSKWREIGQVPGSNALDRCRARGPAEFQLPPTHRVSDTVKAVLDGLERPW